MRKLVLFMLALAQLCASAQVVIQGPTQINGQVVVGGSSPPKPACQITTAAEPPGLVGTPYTGATIQTANCTPPLVYSTTSTIPGLSMSVTTGVWSGTPNTAGNFPAVITVMDSSVPIQSFTATYSINISPNGVPSGGHNEYCNSSNAWTGPASKPVPGGNASAPTACINTALANTPSPGGTVTVTAGSCSDLQTKITNATAGQTIIVPAMNGVVQDLFDNCRISPTATGNASNWITVETDQVASLPSEGSRATPAWVGITSLPARPAFAQPAIAGIYMPKIRTNNNWTIQTQSTAAYWRFIGIEITSLSTGNYSQLVQSTGANHIIWDRVYVHGGDSSVGQSTNDIQAGIVFNACTYCAVIDSTILDTHCGASCTQSQGVTLGGNSVNPTGPLKVTNNYIESAGENIFSGGGGTLPPAVILPSSDVEIRLNHTFKPLFWKQNDPSYFGTHFEVDNAMELKNSQRTWIEGNIFENVWGYQGSQQGNAIILGPRNQSNPFFGSASTDGSGAVTKTGGNAFSSLQVSQYCAVQFHCFFTIENATYEVNTFIDATHITLLPNNNGFPPAGTGLSFTAYLPGLNPNAVNNDIVFTNNAIHHASRVGTVAIGVSNGGDLPAGLNRVYFYNNGADDINGFVWTIGQGACCVWSTGEQIQSGSATLTVNGLTLQHNTFIEFLTGSSPGLGPGFGFGVPVQKLNNMLIVDNISAGGFGNRGTAEQLWTSWVPKAQLCFDHNFFAKATNPFGPNGLGTFKTDNNPPYPGDPPNQAENGGCSFTATGNTQVADFNALQFTANNNGVNVNMQLQATSPAHNAASDGTDAGVNWVALQNAIAGVY